MRTIEKKVEIPASERVEVSYACEEPSCGFLTADERSARLHHGRVHAAGARQEIGGCQFLRFDSEADFAAFMESFNSDEGDRVCGNWDGPGWYGKYKPERRWHGWRPFKLFTLLKAEEAVADWKREAARLLVDADQLCKLIGQ